MGWDLTQPQSDFFWLDCKYPAFVGGFGCMRADTRIWTENGLKNICDILPGERVLSYDQNRSRFVLSPTSGAFPKGKDYLYQVQSQHGEFVSSGHHRSLSEDGTYQQVSQLGSSSVLCRLNDDLLQSISELDLKSLIEDEGRYSQKDVDSLESYGELARRYGQQFLQEAKDAEVCCSLSNGVQESLLVRLKSNDRWGVQEEHSQGRTRLHQSYGHVYRSGFLFLIALLFFFWEGSGLALLVARIQEFLLLILLFLWMILFHRKGELFSSSFSFLERVYNWYPFGSPALMSLHAFCRSRKCSPKNILSVLKSRILSKSRRKEQSFSFYPFSCKSPVINLSTTDTIRVSRKEVKEVYWDLQVLNTNNYIDEYGHIHHNSGKTQTLLARAIRDKFIWPRSTVALYEPTYDLARLILIPRLLELLDIANVPYLHNKSENVIYLLNRGMFVIRTLDKPNRIIGYEAFRSHVDEIDTLKFKNAQNAWNKIIARNRQKLPGNPTNQVCAYTTPEGFNFVYNRWEKNPTKDHIYVRASTYSNQKNLPEDYVDSLRGNYDDNLLEAYVEGIFTNLTSGTVYHKFSRKYNHSDVRIDPGQKEPLHIGMDFNVGRGCAVVHVLRDGLPIAVDEVVNSFDTPDTIRVLNSRYHGWPITVYPDASSKNRKSQNASETDLQLIRNERWRVKKINRNPAVKDRIASMNGMFCNAQGERRYKVNTLQCPFYTDSLEQQAYDANGLPEKGEGKGDDINEAGGYYIYQQFPIKKRVLEQTRLSGL